MQATETEIIPTFRREQIRGEVIYESSDGRFLAMSLWGNSGWTFFHRFHVAPEGWGTSRPRLPDDAEFVRLEDTPAQYPLALSYMVARVLGIRHMLGLHGSYVPLKAEPTGRIHRDEASVNRWQE